MNIVELTRLLHNLIRLGTIAAVDHAAARVRIQSGKLLTDWLPWIESRAGTTRDWDPPTVGEQVIVFSPGGDPRSGIVLTGIFSDASPAPANSGDLWRRVFPDGAVLEYDHQASYLRAELPGSASVTAAGAIAIESGADISITAAGNVAIRGARIDLN
ncbi:phage baseplate assembly protein V [Modicisalibacter radicis]|uniref:phage baseplate assembly protein V n=1 Tax=Halomonas sp. EAR18 TaxID=2518972 RepID=UPI00109CBB44|nr:phage baseplate assembly protein V [Halomonas sp. EAR18]